MKRFLLRLKDEEVPFNKNTESYNVANTRPDRKSRVFPNTEGKEIRRDVPQLNGSTEEATTEVTKATINNKDNFLGFGILRPLSNKAKKKAKKI